MTPTEQANLETARRYLKAIEDREEDTFSFFMEDVVQEEFPNRFMPNGARRVAGAAGGVGTGGR